MNKGSIKAAFDGKKAFIPFITSGDPDLETTKALARCLQRAGASIIELGIPFSDPTAEGPVIQEANIRALEGGVDTDQIFEMVHELREDPKDPVTVPLAFMTYANVVFHYGTDRFCQNAAEAGVNALILPDVPYEEKGEFAVSCERYGLDLISLIAPTSEERIALIASDAQGFIYCVSSMGVTGVRSEFTTDLASIVGRIRESSDLPVAIGFGISNPEQAQKMAMISDGAIVGSAIVKIVAQHGAESVPFVEDFAKAMVAALDKID